MWYVLLGFGVVVSVMFLLILQANKDINDERDIDSEHGKE